MKNEQVEPPKLDTWKTLNEYLQNCTEDHASILLGRERTGKQRLSFMLRIHARFNVLRATRERQEICTIVGDK